jgi:flagellar basal-body rod protein FlgB
MDLSLTGPIGLAERRLAWLDARQRVLSQNIAHADTPNYRPRDAMPFAAALAQAGGPGLLATDARHLVPAGGAARPRPDRVVGERSPNGNAVSLDRQAMKVAETDQAHALAVGLHRKYLGLFRMALGRN